MKRAAWWAGLCCGRIESMGTERSGSAAACEGGKAGSTRGCVGGSREWFALRAIVRGVTVGLVLVGLGAGSGLADTVTWDGGGGSSAWTTGTNWDGNVVPGAGDDVVIPGANTVTFWTTNTVSVNSLDCLGALTVSNGWLNLANASQIQLGGSLNLAGGVVKGAGNLTVNGVMSWTQGTMEGPGSTTVIASGATLTISGGFEKSLSARTLTNHGTVILGGTGKLWVDSSPTISNESGGLFDVQDDMYVDNYGGTATFVNAGTLRKSAGAGTTTMEMVLNNSGTLEVQTGTMALALGGTSSIPTATVSSDATLQFGGGTHTWSAGLTVGEGTVKVSNGTVTLNGTGSLPTLEMPYGTLSVNGATTVQSFDLTGGIQQGNSGLTVNDTMSWTAGTMQGSGSTVIAPGATLTIGGGSEKSLSVRTLTNHGTVVLGGAGKLWADSLPTISNESGALFDVQDDMHVDDYGGTATFVNAGTLRKSAGAGTTTMEMVLNNTGTLEVQTGTLYLAKTFPNFSGSTLTGGTYDVTGTLKFIDANIITNAADITLDGASSQIVNQFAANALAGFASNASGGSLTIRNGRDLTTSGAFGNDGDVTVETGCTFTATGAYTQTGGSTTLADGVVAASGTVDIQGGGLGGNGTVSATVSNGGEVIPGASVGTLNITGDYAQGAGGTLNIEIGGLTAGTQHDVLNVTGAAALDGDLYLELTGGFTPGPDDVFGFMSFGSHSGSFAAITGSPGSLDAASYGASAAVVSTSSTPPVVALPGLPASWTEGSGAVAIDAGATVSDPGSLDLDGGQLTIDFTANGTTNDRLAIEHEGSGAGEVGVSGGNVSFAGTLIGTFVGGTDGATPLVTTFNASCTPAVAQAVLRKITYANVSVAPSELARTVRAVLTDGDGGISTVVTQTVNVSAINDSPVLATNAGLSLSQGVEAVIGTALLQVTDVDNSAGQIIYTVTDLPDYGSLEKSDVALGGGGTFTQQDVDDSHLTYQHDDSINITDAFSFTVSDGAGGVIGSTTFDITVGGAVTESSPFAGISGEVTVGPGGEMSLLGGGLTGTSGTTVDSVTLTLSDLSSPSGIAGSDFVQLLLYRSADGILDGGDTQIGSQGTVQIGSPTTVSADASDVLAAGVEQFYIVTAELSAAATDGKAFRVGCDADAVATSLGGRGSAVTASDANRVRVDVVATQLVFTTQPGGAENGSPLATQPVVVAQDAGGRLDVDFGEVVTLTATGTVGGGTLRGDVDVAAVAGVATFATVAYDVVRSGDTFYLTANDEDGVGSNLAAVDSPALVGAWREFIVPLSAGFNLVSLGQASANDSITSLVEPIVGNLVRVVGFETGLINPNPPDPGGKLYNPSLPGYINTLNLTDVRLAYWLVMSAADTLITGGVPAKVVAQGVTAENGLHPVYDFMGIHGHLRLDGVPAPVGTVVEVVDGQGTLAGRSEVHHAGYYGYLPIYRDDVGSAVDEGAETGEWLRLRVNGQPTGALVQWTEFGDEVQLDVEVVTAGSSPLPTESALGPNYPNPFNPSTTISYELGSEREIVLSIWNLAGQRIRELVRATQAAGPHFVVWDGHSDSGMPVGNGVYLYELRSGDFRSVRKMVLVK